MGFGSFRTIFCIGVFLFFINTQLRAQQTHKTSQYLYDQLDLFLQNPSKSGSLKLSKMIHGKQNKLFTKADQLAWVVVHCNLGYYKNLFGSKTASILYYEKAWKTYQEKGLSDYDIIKNCLQPLGNLYIQIGDLPKAESTITRYLYLAEQIQQKDIIISAITNLSITFNNLGKYSKAIHILEQGLAMDPNNINLLTNIATNYMHSGNMVEAERFAQKVLQIDLDQINAYQILAAVYLEKNDLNNAEQYILKAKSRLLELPNTSSRDIAKLQLGYIDILLSKSSHTEAQKNLNELYAALLPRYNNEGLPTEEILIADPILLKALDVQVYISQQSENPLQAIEAYELAFKVNTKLNQLYPLQDTKLIQHSQNRNRTEDYIDLLFSLYKDLQDEDFIKKAFLVAEHSKAPFVNEALVSKKILSRYKNDSLVSQKDKLTSDLATFETLLLKEKLKGNQANIAQIQQWSTEHSTKSIRLKEVTQKLQQEYPKMLQDDQQLSIPDLQQKLKKDDRTLIEYFYGNQNIYQFIIQSDYLEIKRIENKTLLEVVVKNYINYFNDASKITNNIPEFTKNAAEVFKMLKIPEDTEKLLIIPDGFLSFIPFEALLTEETTSLNFQNMPFLFKSSEVSYEISARKYTRSVSKGTKKNNVLGVFPVFEGTDLELPFSLAESKTIQQYFNGSFLEKKQATYNSFINHIERHSILHLSTHAEAGSFSRPASIKFNDQDILVNQLYGLNISADLVVLSACETGIGKLAKGEGPLSIGRGFQYAGVENVLFSLWRVNDKTTSRLMGGFYKNLNNSKIKSTSLHNAKLDYLNHKDIANAQKSPYYWAAFVYYGEIQDSSSSKFLWFGISILLFIVIILLLRKFLQHKK
ncbi:CHAT domain-containing protein [Aquimarina sp. MMG016]|uniref:CHAT domain-containing protein n=1 Tax=Aquimarina sp. MMG016 TaxID=2822690 RepID=UPI001B39FA94|nr:CHAT domain-containing protein [Aquimarina sp. MMG016]MBQ4818775.1 CHAT domain-containing protein [Aquimarina sp. MMG016]